MISLYNLPKIEKIRLFPISYCHGKITWNDPDFTQPHPKGFQRIMGHNSAPETVYIKTT